MKIATINIIWWGISLGGKHYSGDVNYYDDHNNYIKFPVERSISAKEARLKNKYDGVNVYSPGDRTERFDSEEELIAAAWDEVSKKLGRCILLKNSYGGIGKIVGCPDEVKYLVNILNGVFNVWILESDRFNQETASELEKSWIALFGYLKNL